MLFTDKQEIGGEIGIKRVVAADIETHSAYGVDEADSGAKRLKGFQSDMPLQLYRHQAGSKKVRNSWRGENHLWVVSCFSLSPGVVTGIRHGPSHSTGTLTRCVWSAGA
jgi:hypothetical protein